VLSCRWRENLSKIEKLKKRLKGQPVDFTFDELMTLMTHLGYSLSDLGRTSGSRVAFVKEDDYIRLHRPHPQNTLKQYQILDLIDALKARGLL
jgi:hypothetical protein